MYICQNCGQAYEQSVSFCGSCGSNAISYKDAPHPTAPVLNDSTATTTYADTPEAPEVSGTVAPAIIGSIFGFFSFFLSAYIFWNTILADLAGFSAAHISNFPSVFITLLVCTMAGIIISCNGRKLRGLAITGKVLSILSFVMWNMVFAYALYITRLSILWIWF